MIKLIPLIIFPLSFFLIFLGVKNLTVNFPLEKEKITQNDKKEMIKYNQNSEDVEKKIVKEKEQNFVDVDEIRSYPPGIYESMSCAPGSWVHGSEIIG